MHFVFVGSEDTQNEKRETQTRGNPQPALVVFGSGYGLEYNTGILAVAVPRERCPRGRKTNLFSRRGRTVSASHNATATRICLEDSTWKIIIDREQKKIEFE